MPYERVLIEVVLITARLEWAFRAVRISLVQLLLGNELSNIGQCDAIQRLVSKHLLGAVWRHGKDQLKIFTVR